MNEMEELIAAAERLCNSLDKSAQNEKKFCHNVCHQLELLSWETLKIKNDLKYLKEII